MPYLTKQFKFCAAHKYWNKNWSDEKNQEIFEDDIKRFISAVKKIVKP